VLQFVFASKHGSKAAVLLRVQTVPREPIEVPQATRVEVVRPLCENVVQQMSSKLHAAHLRHGGLQATRAPTTQCRVRANHAAGVASLFLIFSDMHRTSAVVMTRGNSPTLISTRRRLCGERTACSTVATLRPTGPCADQPRSESDSLGFGALIGILFELNSLLCR
jgi:hypothetical protein